MFLLWFIFLLAFSSVSEAAKKKIPSKLPFGASTSAYQIEGAWNEDGKGESIWDNFFHTNRSLLPVSINGDVACDFYHKYKQDIRLAANLGIKWFRFSISWPRILPTGYTDNINQLGINHYKDLVSEMLKHNLTPVATIYHWDLPQKLFEDGFHWNNPDMIPYFVDFARIVIQNLPDVGVWITINEPRQICRLGYALGVNAPGIKNDGIDDYLCAYTVIKAHAEVYHMYKEEFPNYKAKMGISPDCQWIQSLTNKTEDLEAAKRQMQFECGLYYQPIFKGDWPEVVKERIKIKSAEANLADTRLPNFTEEEIRFINGTHDYLGVNHYYTSFVKDAAEAEPGTISFAADQRVNASFDAAIPSGVYKVLKWFEEEYGKHEVIITEIGLGITSSDDGLKDSLRSDYLADFICNILDAINEGVDIKGIMIWSLMDNIEWGFGVRVRFGLYNVDFNSTALTRTPKASAGFIKKLIRRKNLECGKLRRDWINVPLGISISQAEKELQ